MIHALLSSAAGLLQLLGAYDLSMTAINLAADLLIIQGVHFDL